MPTIQQNASSARAVLLEIGRPDFAKHELPGDLSAIQLASGMAGAREHGQLLAMLQPQ